MKKSPVLVAILAIVVAIGAAWFAHIGPFKHRVTLHWAASPGARAYKIYRTTSSGLGYEELGVSMDASFEDKTVKAHTTYYYAVSSLGDDGHESPLSKEIKAEVP